MASSPDGDLALLLVGEPVSHALSPSLHNAALSALFLDGEYSTRQVDRLGLLDVAADLRSGLLDGVNVTAPHKAAAAGLSDELETFAARTGSVNTWVMSDGLLVGHATDVGAISSVLERLPPDPITLLGSGGMAAAVLVAIDEHRGNDAVSMRSRSQASAIRLAESVGREVAVERWSEPVDGGVVINCSPIGLRRGERIPDRFVSGATGLLDVASGRRATMAVSAARSRKIPYADGIDLLVAQAEMSFRLWTGHPAPKGVMERAARSREVAVRGTTIPADRDETRQQGVVQ